MPRYAHEAAFAVVQTPCGLVAEAKTLHQAAHHASALERYRHWAGMAGPPARTWTAGSSRKGTKILTVALNAGEAGAGNASASEEPASEQQSCQGCASTQCFRPESGGHAEMVAWPSQAEMGDIERQTRSSDAGTLVHYRWGS